MEQVQGQCSKMRRELETTTILRDDRGPHEWGTKPHTQRGTRAVPISRDCPQTLHIGAVYQGNTDQRMDKHPSLSNSFLLSLCLESPCASFKPEPRDHSPQSLPSLLRCSSSTNLQTPPLPSIHLFHPGWSVQGPPSLGMPQGLRLCSTLHSQRPMGAWLSRWASSEDNQKIPRYKKESHEVMKWIQQCWSARRLGKRGSRETDSVSLTLAKGEDVLVGRVIPGCWAAAPSDIQDRRGGDRKETSTLGSQLSHIFISYSSLDTFQVAKKNRCPFRGWCFVGARVRTPGTKLSPLTSAHPPWEQEDDTEREHKLINQNIEPFLSSYYTPGIERWIPI